MKNLSKYLCFPAILCLLIICPNQGFSQISAPFSPLYSFYTINGQFINPAFTGSRGVTTADLYFRKQWSGMAASPTTYAFTLDAQATNPQHNTGLMVLHDQWGVTSTTEFRGQYAFRVELGPGHLAFGLQGGLGIISINHTDYEATTVNDPVFEGTPPPRVSPRAGFGSFYHTDRWKLGISIPELIVLDGRSKANSRLNVFAEFKQKVGRDIELIPSLMLRSRPQGFTQTDLNLNVLVLNKFLFGAGLQSKNLSKGQQSQILPTGLISGLSLLMRVQISNQFRLSYTYQHSILPVNGFSHPGGHGMLISYLFKVSPKSTLPSTY